MFKRLGSMFGSDKKDGKAKDAKTDQEPRPRPGDGIRQFAALLPEDEKPTPARPAPPPAQAAVPQAPAAAPAAPPPEPAKPKPDPANRETLIREAMRIRRNKAKDLDELPARDRKRLQLLAEKMMGVAPEPPAEPGNGAASGKPRGPSGTRH